MRRQILTITTIMAFGITLFGCKAEFSTGTNTAKSNAASSPTNAAPKTNSNSNSTSTAKTEKPKTELKNEPKPTEGKEKKAKNIPVPSSWIHIYDSAKGYGFYVPEGTTGEAETIEGIDTFVAVTPDPNEVTIYVMSYNDKTLTKENLLDDAVKFLEDMDNTVTKGALKAEGEDYAIADTSTVGKDGTKSKQRIMVGTDVSDNYIMILETPADKFAANEKTIDEIWGNFEMWSGGASNN